MKGLSYYVYNIIYYDENSSKILSNSDNHIMVYGDENEAYQNLFDCGILYKELPYSRVHIKKYSLLDHGFKLGRFLHKIFTALCTKWEGLAT